MKREIAERLAATKVEHVTVLQAQAIIEEFLTQLACCPVCDGTGNYTFGRDVQVEVSDGPRKESRVIPAGTRGSCPRCGSKEPNTNGQGDPEWVAWHCAQGNDDQRCQTDREDREDRRNGHAKCGYRVMIPFDGVKKADS